MALYLSACRTTRGLKLRYLTHNTGWLWQLTVIPASEGRDKGLQCKLAKNTSYINRLWV